MCYYATTDYACGDWKWGNMKLRCPRQHRMGETCGAKLVHDESVTKDTNICKICTNIETKRRRLNKEYENISRWSKEGDKFRASIEKARVESQKLQGEIRDLYQQRPKVKNEIQPPSQSYHSQPASQVNLPPIGHMVDSASRHAPVVQGSYASQSVGYDVNSRSRHAPSHASGSASSSSARPTASYPTPPTSRHSTSSYNSYSDGR